MKKAKDGIQLVSVTNHFKFQAPDGKQRFADALDAECVQTVAQHYPNNRANASSIGLPTATIVLMGRARKKPILW